MRKANGVPPETKSGMINKQTSARCRSMPRSQHRGNGFSHAETATLLDSTECVLPVGGYEWKRVLTMHKGRWENMGRKEDGVRRKFSKLHNSALPTGDPFVPLDVTRANGFRQRILAKIDMDDLVDDCLDFEDVLSTEYNSIAAAIPRQNGSAFDEDNNMSNLSTHHPTIALKD